METGSHRAFGGDFPPAERERRRRDRNGAPRTCSLGQPGLPSPGLQDEASSVEPACWFWQGQRVLLAQPASPGGQEPCPVPSRPAPSQVAAIRAVRPGRAGGACCCCSMGWAWGALGVAAAAAACWGLLPSPLPLVALLSALGVAAWGAWRPLRLRRSPESVGYLGEPGWSPAQVARRVRKSRRTGQLPPVYPNGWFRLLDSAQLARGEVRSVAALGEQFAVFRDLNGQSYVLDAYCPHLGANLSVGGRVVGSCIECPFHGWQFSGKDGKCTRIPYAKKVPEFATTKVWPSCEIAGMILIWYHCDGVSPTWQVPEQEEVASEEWVFHGITEHFVNAHIEEIPENAADIAHLSFLHGPCILSGVDLQHTKSTFWNFIKHNWKADWQPDAEPNTHCSCMTVKHSLTIFGKHLPILDVTVLAKQIGPGLVFLLFKHSFLGHGVMIQSVTPVEPLLQQVIHRMYYQRTILGFIPKFTLWAESIQFERDIMIWNNKQYVSKPLLVKEDAAIQRHRRWYSQFYSAHSVKFTGQKDGLDW
ncbi:cholesterol 7-desaturase nvd-like [Heteronotia binoei]|uniref:cholesterol 7-desaturase nvd-like n=1 Tax=Heteronotia binoei TaxID=13085 RepID=UPI00292CB7E6|nr:cholesterol 7-desaturase nvd-like [Heteronotia binoei]